MKHATPKPVRREDYRPPPFFIDDIALRFVLDEDCTTVTATSRVRRNPTADPTSDLVLDGADLELLSVSIDGAAVDKERLARGAETLTISGVADAFSLEIVTTCNPKANKSLEGLYVSSGNFCTQCEAEGFRKITFFLDRPDIMARYRTTIIGDKARYPVMLSNGNCISSEDLDDGRHQVVWEDPFKKPSYLFALVAGKLVRREDTFVTQSGRTVDLHVFVEPANLDKTAHCMTSLKKSMKWDEERFGREYDLDLFQIVAVGDFNMGAMENKGLNIFNTKYVLARPETATDRDYAGIEGVVGHEYFHNWSGNRVTCRDWFQLSLKEGFTVYRDQEFSSDMGARAEKRIEDVERLRVHQFHEDAGPTAHPVRPDAYVEINNFYTVTVYEKGAEVVRMIETLIGREAFRKGSDLYFERHDGQAVTCDDFVQAMADASGRDLSQFSRWYAQAGTPEIKVDTAYDQDRQTFAVTLQQTVPPTPGQPHKKPMHMPVVVGLLGPDGQDLPLSREGAPDRPEVLELTEERQTFIFHNVAQPPVPSILRGFSAPVRLVHKAGDDALTFQMAHDSDPYCRWNAAQDYALRVLYTLIDGIAAGRAPAAAPGAYADAFGTALSDRKTSPAALALALTLPPDSVIADHYTPIPVEAVHQGRQHLAATLAVTHHDLLLERYRELHDNGPYVFEPAAVGRRRLKNLCLSLLVKTGADADIALARDQYDAATNMTDRLAALAALSHLEHDARDHALADFYQRFKDDALVLDKWFGIQASSRRGDTLDEVTGLLSHEAFSLENPNKVRALLGTFAGYNAVRFHDASGRGYALLTDQILALDKFNPQVAARLVARLGDWRRHDDNRAGQMKDQLERILRADGLSPDVFELAQKSVAQG